MSQPASAPDQRLSPISVDWSALEDAFENNSILVRSYIHARTGEVTRLADDAPDPELERRIAGDAAFLPLQPISSREQYRWMELFIPTVGDPDLAGRLWASIAGKGAFRRFKAQLADRPERDAWYALRAIQVRSYADAWLRAHGLEAANRPAPRSAAEPRQAQAHVAPAGAAAADGPGAGPASSDAAGERREASGRRAAERPVLLMRLFEIAESLGPRELGTLAALAEFLHTRRLVREARA